jgi:hypothetical protein
MANIYSMLSDMLMGLVEYTYGPLAKWCLRWLHLADTGVYKKILNLLLNHFIPLQLVVNRHEGFTAFSSNVAPITALS